MATWPASGDTDWNTKMLAYLAIEHNTDGTHKAITAFGIAPKTELTISSGAVTITQSYHTIDTESDAATDDLDTISGGTEGRVLIIRPASSSRTIVAKDGTGNLRLAGDFSMDDNSDILTLLDIGVAWVELSRSNNV